MWKKKLVLPVALLILHGCKSMDSSEAAKEQAQPPVTASAPQVQVIRLPAPPPEVVVQTRTVDTYCSTEKPITMSPQDVLVDETFNQIVAHNKMWVSKCVSNGKK